MAIGKIASTETSQSLRLGHKINILLWIKNAFKRLVDIIAAFVGLLLLSPLFVFLILLIKRDTRGPCFFKGKRAGFKGKPFYIFKFRTFLYSSPILICFFV